MLEEQKKVLLDFKARQEAGERLPCPRCGRNTIKPALYSNALSRAFDIMVCDECGVSEALESFVDKPKPVGEWACMND